MLGDVATLGALLAMPRSLARALGIGSSGEAALGSPADTDRERLASWAGALRTERLSDPKIPLGQAAARVVEALVTTSRRAPSVLAVLGGEFGVRNRVGVLPCFLSPAGIAQARVPDLSARERVQLGTALGG